MNAEQRAKLIRERLKTLYPVAVAPMPGPKRKRLERPQPGKFSGMYYGEGLREPERRKKWLLEADEKAPDMPRTKHRTGVPALVKIAAAYPVRLPRSV